MQYHEALAKAAHVRDALAPWCERITIAGSIRRQKPEVKDIEIVAIPQQAPVDLFGNELGHCEGFRIAVHSLGTVTSGSTVDGKLIKVLLHDGTKLDLFTTTAAQWGYILTLRTGSKEHNMKLMARLKANGYDPHDGAIRWKGEPLPSEDEATVFKRAGLAYVEPQHRAA